MEPRKETGTRNRTLEPRSGTLELIAVALIEPK